MRKRRLRHLIAILETVRDTRQPFSMSVWIATHADGVTVGGVAPPHHVCGTACCALGYAALDPKFRRKGLTLRAVVTQRGPVEVASVADFNKLDVKLKRKGWSLDDIRFTATKDGRTRLPIRAAAKFFDIPRETADWLFLRSIDEHGRPYTPDDVIARVERVIAGDISLE